MKSSLFMQRWDTPGIFVSVLFFQIYAQNLSRLYDREIKAFFEHAKTFLLGRRKGSECFTYMTSVLLSSDLFRCREHGSHALPRVSSPNIVPWIYFLSMDQICSWQQVTKLPLLYTKHCLWAVALHVTQFCLAALQSCRFCAPSFCRTHKWCTGGQAGVLRGTWDHLAILGPYFMQEQLVTDSSDTLFPVRRWHQACPWRHECVHSNICESRMIAQWADCGAVLSQGDNFNRNHSIWLKIFQSGVSEDKKRNWSVSSGSFWLHRSHIFLQQNQAL